MRLKSGSRLVRSPSRDSLAQPSRPDAYRTGKSSCSSVAPRAANKSKAASSAASGSALGLSTLLSTRIGRRPSASAFESTNLVCGIGPSAASISNRQPSTMERIRSTSPPKSAWPGVSTMFNRTGASPFSQRTDVHLAKIVMPRSRSMSLESMARSAISECASTAPDWRNISSTRVVLP